MNMNYRNRNPGHSIRTAALIFLFLSILLFSIDISSAALDCPKCHAAAEPGKFIKARDTIEISNKTCLKCHNPDYPPTPIGYNTHLAHMGEYSVKKDYLDRHPDTANSVSCANCHIQKMNCKNCHIIGIPHINTPPGENCRGCHGEMNNLFRHPTINLKIHNLFNQSNIIACTMCHDPDNVRLLKLTGGETASIEEPHTMCYQCHSGYYNSWDAGSHYANKTMPSGLDVPDMPQLKQRWENNWRKENTCTNCHNPHSPNELYQMPEIIKILKTTGISMPFGTSGYFYIILFICIVIIIFVLIKYKIKSIKNILGRLKFKSSISFPKISIPRISIPKISIPISIEEIKIKETTKQEMERKEISTDTKDTKPSNITEKRPILEKIELKKPDKKFDFKHRGNILFVFGIVAMFGLFYIIFGTFMPMAVLVSESMSPHLEKGDIVFFKDINKIDKIKTYNDKNYNSFDNYGNVILYRPYGQEKTIPTIHRAMYYVEEGEEMWQGGPKAPYAGYITKGDNIITNSKYDQQTGTSYQKPVKKEWIVGVAMYKIPYVGYIRLILPV